MSTRRFVQCMKVCSISLMLMLTLIVVKAGEFPFLYHAHDASGNIQTAIDEINARLKSIGVTNTLASNIVVQASTFNNGVTVTGGGVNVTGASTFSNAVEIASGDLDGNSSGQIAGFDNHQTRAFTVTTNGVAWGDLVEVNSTSLAFIVTGLAPNVTNIIVADVDNP